MKKIILLLAMCFSVSTFSFSQNIQDSEQIIVRCIESNSKSSHSKILISYGEGKTEEIQLETIGARNLIEGHSKNIEIINKVLLNLRNAGYEIISSTGSYYSNSYILVKKEG